MRSRTAWVILVILIIVMNTALSGCWSKREVQQVSICTGIGIDMASLNGKTQFYLSLLVLQTSAAANRDSANTGNQGNSSPARLISAYGETIYDALRNSNLRSSRQLFLGHAQVLILGNSITAEGLGEIVDFFNRHKDTRYRTLVMAYDGSAQAALQAQPQLEAIIPQEIKQLILQNGPRVSKSEAVNVFQMSYDLLNPGRELVLPRLQLVTPECSGPLTSPSSPENAKPEASAPQNKVVKVGGSIVYRDHQRVGAMNEEETQGMLFIKNEFRGGIIPLTRSEQHYSILMKKASSKIETEYNEGKLIINIRLKGSGDLQEGGSASYEITPRLAKELEQSLNETVNDRCHAALHKSQSLHSDVFGFGDKIHRQNPQLWKEISAQWDGIYPGIEVKLSCDFSIEHYGQIK